MQEQNTAIQMRMREYIKQGRLDLLGELIRQEGTTGDFVRIMATDSGDAYEAALQMMDKLDKHSGKPCKFIDFNTHSVSVDAKMVIAAFDWVSFGALKEHGFRWQEQGAWVEAPCHIYAAGGEVIAWITLPEAQGCQRCLYLATRTGSPWL